MAFVIETPNPFEPLRSTKQFFDEELSIWDWVRQRHPVGEFPVPTICIVNGHPVKREGWDYRLKKEDIVNFIAVPAGIETIIIAVIAVALVAISLAFTLGMPKVPGEQPASDPVFSTKGQQNAIRLGEPIEVNYGRNRIYPSYASRPYFEYINNDQFQFSLFCLGQGEYEISTIQIGDTSIDDFQEVEYEVIPPGSPVTLFPSAVYTSAEAGGQTLYGPNEDEYVGDGWVGPFPASEAGTESTKIQVDVVFPRGIYSMNKKGKLQEQTIVWEAQARLIDDLGNPLDDWFNLFESTTVTVSARTTTPQRKTYSEDVSLGRYEVRLRRTNNTLLTHNAGHEIVWEALRSYLDVDIDFGDVTLLAVKIRATNNLNERTQERFNVICTRKLPIRESADFGAPIATRSIVWALVDVFRSNYGGRIDDSFFDWDALEELDAIYADRGEYFDWTFRDPITVWEAAQTVARVGRAVPLLSGSLITVKRDGALDLPVAMFNQENIIQGSFTWDIKLWDLDEYDSVRVEYTDPATGYKQETVTCTLPGGTSNHPQDIRFAGIQDRDHAYREGLYIRAQQRYLRENITFDTGLEGYIPTFGDLIAVVHDVPRWGQGGFVVHAVQHESEERYQLWVSEPLTFTSGEQHVISLRGRQGQILGPFDAFPTQDTKQVSIQATAEIDFLFGGENEPMLFVFGLASDQTKFLRVVKVEPQGGETIRISAVNDAPIIHTFDELTAPALNQPSLPPVTPPLPEISEIQVNQIDDALQIVHVSWTAAFGAQYYIIQTSEDGENWRERLTTTRSSIQMQVFPGDLWVRVAAVNEGQGPWIQTTLVVTYLLGLNLVTPWVALEWGIDWQEVVLATSYLVSVYDNSESFPILKRQETVTTREYTYNLGDALDDGNLVREMIVKVDPIFQDEAPDAEDAVELELSNAIPSPPTNPGSEISSVESDFSAVIYRLFWTVPAEEDLIRVKVWLSAVSGFDPNVLAPEVDEIMSAAGSAGIPTEAFVSIDLDSNGEHVTYYWRVALFDVWGNEISTNITAEQTIPAYS